MFYSVVLLDGNELHCLSFEEVQDLFFKRRINQSSLICNAEDGQWQMLKKTFDLSQWISSAIAADSAVPKNYQPTVNPFEQTNSVNQAENFKTSPNPADQPVTFNQFPPNPPNQSNPYGQNTSNGYSQNNQTETYYQAETSQTNYNFQNNQTNFTPSKYNNPANSQNYSQNPNNFAQNFAPSADHRNGAKPAAVFILINAFFYVIFNIVASTLTTKSAGSDENMKMGEAVGRSIIPLIIDLYLAVKLWKMNDVESARKWVLARAYFGFIIFGIIIPFLGLKTGDLFIAAFSFVATFFYFLSLTLVLHGKKSPSQSRVMVGMGTFAIYFLVMFGAISLTVIGNVAPEITKLDIKNSQLEKYKIEGSEFQDKTTGAKVVLPEGWSMISLDNPLIHTPEARMIAIDNAGNRLTMLEVVPVPGNLDMKRQNSSLILDQLADGVVIALRAQIQENSGFTSKNSLNEVTRMSIFIGKHPAKLLVFDKIDGGEKVKGHLIITFDELTFYVLHSWCPAAEYDQAQNDFMFFEKNFTVPEKLNSTFTQSAENEKKR